MQLNAMELIRLEEAVEFYKYYENNENRLSDIWDHILDKIRNDIKDLEFVKETNEAIKRHEKGLFKSKSDKEFLEMLEKI